ncbi:FtsH protease activity modulator HflK [Sedimentisphaera salicampi]|uniref:FtsH protease activity modulator HflK n=1 Tax=Sedimentisphaera salicampi TaxID=1941349 RepID=UPI000B9AA509|nr:FtsH protease activity modulator HflK [Sedimentisphaera salicampi]OXU15237.1 Modulator of FtsH protease HflK [Sedimentisphaera salicampi]
MVKQFFDAESNFSKYILLGIGAALVIGIINGSFYTVNTDERAVVTRFGEFSRTAEPGLHFKLPFGIEAVSTPKVTTVFKEEFGFRTLKAGVESQYDRRDFSSESLMLCGDLSVADVQWIVQYRIIDPQKYLFNIRDHRKMLRDVAEAVVRREVGDSSVDEVLTERRMEINELVEDGMQKILDDYESGLFVVTVKMQDVNPPDPVKHAFNEVNAAQQEKEKLINSAKKEYNEIIPKKRGEAQKMVQQAEAYAVKRVNEAEGDAGRFREIYNNYKNSKDVTRTRMYLEAVNEAFPEIGQLNIIDKEVESLLPHMNLNKKEESK